MTLQDFVNKYGLDVSFEQMYQVQNKMKRVNNFLFEDTSHSEKQRYLDGLKYMLSAYMEKQINPTNIEKSATLEKLDFAQFIRDYEDAKKDEFIKSNSKRTRKAYENVGAQALDEVLEQAQSFNKSLIHLWADRIKQGVNLDDFRNATSQSNKNSLDVAVIAHKSLEKVINERTWKWRLNPLNWSRLREENKYMRELSNIIAPMKKEQKLTYDVTLGLYLEPVISLEKSESFEQFCQNVKTNNKTQNNDAKKDEQLSDTKQNELDITIDLENVDDNFEPALPVNDDDLFNLSVIDHQIELDDNEELPAFSFADEQNSKAQDKEKPINAEPQNKKSVQKTDSLPKPLNIDVVKELSRNQKAIKIIDTEVIDLLAKSDEIPTKKAETARKIRDSIQMLIGATWRSSGNMNKYATDMFKRVYGHLETSISQMSVKDKLVAAQKITDFMLHVYSPVGSDEKFSQYGDNYSIKKMDAEDIQTLTGCGENAKEILENVKVELGIQENVKVNSGVKENVMFLNNEFGEKSSVKSAKLDTKESPVQIKIKE
jgi:hypothetical protein